MAKQEGGELAKMPLSVSEWVTEFRWDVLDANGSQVAEFRTEAEARFHVDARKAEAAMRMGCMPVMIRADWWEVSRAERRILMAPLTAVGAVSGLTALALAWDVLQRREGRAT